MSTSRRADLRARFDRVAPYLGILTTALLTIAMAAAIGTFALV